MLALKYMDTKHYYLCLSELSNIHAQSDRCIMGNSGFGILPKDTWACGLEEEPIGGRPALPPDQVHTDCRLYMSESFE